MGNGRSQDIVKLAGESGGFFFRQVEVHTQQMKAFTNGGQFRTRRDAIQAPMMLS
jgi:hypothetical protein